MSTSPHSGRAVFWRAVAVVYGLTALVVTAILCGAADPLLRALRIL